MQGAVHVRGVQRRLPLGEALHRNTALPSARRAGHTARQPQDTCKILAWQTN